jgi:hypothetical protein
MLYFVEVEGIHKPNRGANGTAKKRASPEDRYYVNPRSGFSVGAVKKNQPEAAQGGNGPPGRGALRPAPPQADEARAGREPPESDKREQRPRHRAGRGEHTPRDRTAHRGATGAQNGPQRAERRGRSGSAGAGGGRTCPCGPSRPPKHRGPAGEQPPQTATEGAPRAGRRGPPGGGAPPEREQPPPGGGRRSTLTQAPTPT